MEKAYKVYIDACESSGRAAIFKGNVEFVYTGTTLYSMSTKNKSERYRAYADQHDVRFISNDDVPQIDFYTVPRVDIFARDSRGGLFGTVGQETDIKEIATICYIDESRACFFVADSLNAFLLMLAAGHDWRSVLRPYPDVLFFKSKSDAAQRFEIFDFRRKFPNLDR